MENIILLSQLLYHQVELLNFLSNDSNLWPPLYWACSGEHIPLVSLQKYSSKGEADNLCSSSGIEHQDLIVRCSKIITIEKGKIVDILMTSIWLLMASWWQIDDWVCLFRRRSLCFRWQWSTRKLYIFNFYWLSN